MKKTGIHKLYNKDPIEADKQLWGRISNPVSRRGFLKNAGLATITTVLGAPLVFAEKYPAGLIPALLANETEPFEIPGKHPEMRVLNDRPINMEAPPHLLDDPITPSDKLFVRNNGIVPKEIDPNTWTLTIEGESVISKKSYSLAELKSRFEHHSYQLTIECGGNGRYEYDPPAKGNQWSTGAVGCPKWTGVRLKDVLKDAGLKDNAVYIGYYGKDVHLSNEPGKPAISRGVPLVKALEEESLIAWAMNGEELPVLNGYPLRLVFGGWPASTSGKWLYKIVVRDQVHDGEKMGGQSYRIPCAPVAPGSKVEDEDMCIIESMPVKSLITYPKSGAMINPGRKLKVRGHAWAGDFQVKEMEVSIDFGINWKKCQLNPPSNRLAWQQWNTEIDFPESGYYEIWARASDNNSNIQPMVVPGWNPKGYVNNACHRIAIKVK
jgi:DMSO/TMAO reductase YedYZ molybdopterin-dependent catalytic subunit